MDSSFPRIVCAGLFFLLLALQSVAQDSRKLSGLVYHQDGKTVFHAKAVPKELINPWPKKLEEEFQKRAVRIINAQTRDIKAGVNTYFENEKRTYGFLMAHVLDGNSEQALKFLQARDHQHQEWHRETSGIDYYACFTLKHQMRKYFYFGDLLDPEYRKQMREGAKKWTEKDPFRRPHYSYQGPKQGWGPDAKNSWVDIRSTENLYLMRITSVFLMAEETGNRQTASLYKDHILNYTRTLYRVGIGEWDSENYHGHSIAPLLNLYDFARDFQVKSAAKACLDFYAAAGAIKYWRGGFNGPTKRDYNHAQPFGGSAANALWVWFGDHPSEKQNHWESDEVHQITSAYRPPLAVVNLARKKFNKPQELFSAKPAYEATTHHQAESQPLYHETQYFGHSFQMGSLASGTSIDGGDVNGFKILAFDKQQGAIALHAIPGRDPNYPGSPMYRKGVVSAENCVAQMKNLAIWLAKDGHSPWLWVIPDDVQIQQEGGITFLKSDRTWIAIHALNARPLMKDTELTAILAKNPKTRFPGHMVLSTQGTGNHFCGIAVHVGEKETHQTFENFKKQTRLAEVDLSEIEQGVARYRTTDGKWLGIHWNDDPMKLGIWRNGKRRNLNDAAIFESSMIRSQWGGGELEINCGGASYFSRVNEQGIAQFKK